VAGVTSPHEIAPGTALPERRVHARNLFADSTNRIHDDAVARQHGFAGALVAGVTIYGYLARIAVETWGIEWLRHGTATVRFARPIYDGDLLTLSGRIVGRSGRPEAGEALAAIEARTPGGEVAATMMAGVAWGGPLMGPDLARYPAAPLPASRAPAAPEALRRLGPLGSPELALDATLLARTADDLDNAAPLYRGHSAILHPALLLGQANRILAENVALGPWIHAASDVLHCDVARAGDRLETRGRVARVYEWKGRDWVDLDLVVVADDARAIVRIRHTAIYRMPASVGEMSSG
jgi:acyl dehydratase